MRTTARVFGHSLHPILITLPLGAFTASVIFDIAHFASGTPLWSTVALWNMGLGILGALVAAVPGFVDWLRIPRATRARSVGVTHMLVQLLGTTLFAVDWLLRYYSTTTAGPGLFVLSLCALFLLVLGGWLGGELVERLGIGVWEDAQPDAPSSLRRERRRAPGNLRPTDPRPI